MKSRLITLTADLTSQQISDPFVSLLISYAPSLKNELSCSQDWDVPAMTATGGNMALHITGYAAQAVDVAIRSLLVIFCRADIGPTFSLSLSLCGFSQES